MRRIQVRAARRQRGLTLIIVLLILVVVTLLGLGAAQIALLGERSTRYDRDYLIASQAAEAALMDAEFDIRGPNADLLRQRMDAFDPLVPGDFVPGCGNFGKGRGLCASAAEGKKQVWATVDFTETGAAAHTVEFGEFTGRVFDAGPSGVKPDRPPRYIIEQVEDRKTGNDASSKTPRMMYRITAIGFGPRPDIQVVMQIALRKEEKV